MKKKQARTGNTVIIPHLVHMMLLVQMHVRVTPLRSGTLHSGMRRRTRALGELPLLP
ncbi:hypothetical protein [Fontibacillus panacisegetis]|uniref:hypothetical protein n=1 Tax=Fontibacillus panacisegetis TaxID=670482 RepID=UPI0015875EC6|nr:hypothetical protein [Fontibacillus panacisegetis]